MNAYILSIGAELLHGHITDTNATYLSQELDARGIELLHVVQVGDDRNRIRESIERALSEADIVICTGGIGPTEDDLTREGIADALGETPEVDPDLRAEVEAFFQKRGLVMPERNAKQAWLIPSAEALPNPVGTAPGWFVETDGKVIVSLPGVPREMKRMWAEQAAPRIGSRLSGRSYSSVTLKTIGLGESALEDAIVDLVAKTNPIVATYAKDDGVHVRVVGIADDEESARAIRDEAAAEVSRRLQRWLYGEDEVTLAGSIAAQLRDRGL
jgi:nicotinamide-nucleotide amidase